MAPSGAKKSSIVNEGARATLEQNWTGGLGSSGVLRDCNNLKLLTGCTDYIPNSFAHQRPCHWGYEGNRTALRVRFVLSHDTIFLYAPIVAPEGHRAAGHASHENGREPAFDTPSVGTVTLQN